MAELGEPLSRPVNRSDPTRIRRLCLAWGGLAIAFGWAITQALLPNGVLYLDVALLFLNGLAVAIYGPMLWIARTPKSPWIGLAVLGGLGISHFFWLLPASGLVLLAGMRGSVPLENGSMYVATGGVLGIAVLSLCRTWRVIPWLIVGTCISTALGIWGGGTTYLNWRPHELGLACLPLHLCVASALFTEAMRCIGPASKAIKQCNQCQYDLTGLASGPCPECGKSIE
jgi:hypothetical protein